MAATSVADANPVTGCSRLLDNLLPDSATSNATVSIALASLANAASAAGSEHRRCSRATMSSCSSSSVTSTTAHVVWPVNSAPNALTALPRVINGTAASRAARSNASTMNGVAIGGSAAPLSVHLVSLASTATGRAKASRVATKPAVGGL